jgi:hypothetical protein
VPFRGRFNMRFGFGVGLLLCLAGCQLMGKDDASSDVAPPAAIQGPAVEVTTLPPIGAVPSPATGEVADPLATAQPTPVVKTAGQILCEQHGGRFVAFGKTGAMLCQKPTSDGGKQCRRESDCDGVCLARSNSCAPVKPLLGCQDVLQNDGRRVELCID